TGGAGIYYHFDYVGGPRNYKWLNTVPITKVWEQMHLAYEHGADRIWIVNVGDLKPMEFPMEFFLTLARNPGRWPSESIPEYTREWARREFGARYANEIAELVSRYTKYNGWRKPELLEPGTFSLVNYQEADRVVGAWRELTATAERINALLPEAARPAFFELVLYPVKASAQVAELYVTAGKNRLFAAQGRSSANLLAAHARALFDADARLSHAFNHELLHGKWDHMMDQTHIGYTYWQQPPSNTLPRLMEIAAPVPADMGIAVEGSTNAWPGSTNEAELPEMDVFNGEPRWIDVFNRGQEPFEFTATSLAPWIHLRLGDESDLWCGTDNSPRVRLSDLSSSVAWGTVRVERRGWLDIDWKKAPKNRSKSLVTLERPGQAPVAVAVRTFFPTQPGKRFLTGYVQADGHIAIEAEHYSRRVNAGGVQWVKMADYGRTLSSMIISPVTAKSAEPPRNCPCLEYQVYLFQAGPVEVTSIVAPTLNVVPGRGLRYGISFDDETPQVATAVPKGFFVDNGNRDWEASVRNNCREIRTRHVISKPGYHTLKFWMVDPELALEKLVVDAGGLRPSYFGPPESAH
ncbi:MAG TPA: glycosyl hydrolase 115 family protein, partial [Verrucomicrobiae bacterium]|nr:glycosyl hydrolase 115 family protein [Verrucomicrobiae bacterium]